MTTMYRSPNVVIGEFEWHLLVRKKEGRLTTVHYWRPLSRKAFRWLPVTSWTGPKPSDLHNRMWPFRTHIKRAMDSEKVRTEAISRLERQRMPTAMAMRNPGRLEGVAA